MFILVAAPSSPGITGCNTLNPVPHSREPCAQTTSGRSDLGHRPLRDESLGSEVSGANGSDLFQRDRTQREDASDGSGFVWRN